MVPCAMPVRQLPMTANGDAWYRSTIDILDEVSKPGAGLAVSKIGIRPKEMITEIYMNRSIESGFARVSKNCPMPMLPVMITM